MVLGAEWLSLQKISNFQPQHLCALLYLPWYSVSYSILSFTAEWWHSPQKICNLQSQHLCTLYRDTGIGNYLFSALETNKLVEDILGSYITEPLVHSWRFRAI